MTGNSHGVVYFCGLDNFMTDMAVGVELLLMLSNLWNHAVSLPKILTVKWKFQQICLNMKLRNINSVSFE